MTPEPDKAGFVEAQARLVAKLGKSIVFKVPNAPEWPPGTVLDPETGEPYDPTVVPVYVDGAEVDVPVVVGVVTKTVPAGTEAEVEATAAGLLAASDAALIVNPDDYPPILAATYFILDDVRHKITNVRTRGISGIEQFIVFGEAA